MTLVLLRGEVWVPSLESGQAPRLLWPVVCGGRDTVPVSRPKPQELPTPTSYKLPFRAMGCHCEKPKHPAGDTTWRGSELMWRGRGAQLSPAFLLGPSKCQTLRELFLDPPDQSSCQLNGPVSTTWSRRIASRALPKLQTHKIMRFNKMLIVLGH